MVMLVYAQKRIHFCRADLRYGWVILIEISQDLLLHVVDCRGLIEWHVPGISGSYCRLPQK